MLRLKYINQLLLLCFAILYSSCEDVFKPDIDITEYESMLVVEGVITNESGPFKVRLSASVPLDTLIDEIPVYGAEVKITDDQGNLYQLFQAEDGWYETQEQNLQAVKSRNYKLNITSPDGTEYESSVVALTEGPQIESIDFVETQHTNFESDPPRDENWLDIKINTTGEPGEMSYVKWDLEETWEIKIPDDIKVADSQGNLHDETVKPNEEMRHCWVSSKVNSIKVAGTDKQEVNTIRNYPLISLGPSDNRLDIKYSLLVRQYSMNKELFDFWQKLKDNNENLGSMFDKTPSSIYGNISCCNGDKRALGYFMVSEIKEKRIFIDRSEHKVRTVSGYENCTYAYSRLEDYVYFGETIETHQSIYNNAPQCINCLNEGSNQKPSFWE